MRYILYVMGIFCWIDWLPYLDYTSLNYFNYFIIILFILSLLGNIKFLFPLNKLQKILIVYLIYMILCSLLHEHLFKLTTSINILTIVLIMNKKISKSKYLVNGFVFGGFLTALYMILMTFNIIEIVDFSALNQFNFGDYFLNSQDKLLSIGFTNKYNKLSYLFAFLICIINLKLNLKTIFKFALTALIIYLQIKTTGRGGLLISILFITILSILNKKRFILLPIIITTAFYVLSSNFFLEVGKRFSSDDSSLSSRVSQFRYVLENFHNNSIFGIGYRSMSELTESIYIHNFFLNNLIMGGIIGFVIALYFIVILLQKIMNSKMPKELRIFIFMLIIMQTMFENFNLILAMGSYLLVWVLIKEYEIEENNTLNNS